MSILINGMDMPKNGRVTIDLASEETGTNILVPKNTPKAQRFEMLVGKIEPMKKPDIDNIA